MIQVRNNHTGEKSIDIDISQTLTVSLRGEEYNELLKLLTKSMAEKVMDSDAYYEKANAKRKQCNEFIEEIREVFYDMRDMFVLTRSVKDIDTIKLEEVLDKHSKLLGFM